MISRRQLLKALGATGLSLPLFSGLPKGRAQSMSAGDDAPHPKRLILFYTPNGTKKELWRPTHMPGPLTELGPILNPLSSFMDRLVLLDGVDLKAAQEGPGGPHQRGMASLFTGSVINAGDFVGGDGRKAGWASGLSVDQFIAQHIGQETPFKSLELGVRVNENIPRGRICYAGPDQPLPPENDPMLLYQRLFGGTAESLAVTQRRLRRRGSALDVVFQDFQQLERRLGAQDREKLQQHAQNLRELERRLSLISNSTGVCQASLPPEFGDVMSDLEFDSIARQQIDLMVMALACDQTRVASLQCSTAVNALRFNFLEPAVTHEGHSLSHAGDSNEMMQPEWERNLTWYSSVFEYLLTRLSEVPEGDGTLLDHTLVVWGNEISRGNTHDLTDIPFILAGGGGQKIPLSRYLKYDGVSHNQLLLGLIHSFDIEADSFGAPHLNAGVLDGLLA
jgi:hypothetical protein